MFIELMQQYRTVLADLKFETFEGKQVLEQINSHIGVMNSILNSDLPESLSDSDRLAYYLYFPSGDAEGLERDVQYALSILNPYFRMVYHVLKYQSNIKRDLKYKNTLIKVRIAIFVD